MNHIASIQEKLIAQGLDAILLLNEKNHLGCLQMISVLHCYGAQGEHNLKYRLLSEADALPGLIYIPGS